MNPSNPLSIPRHIHGLIMLGVTAVAMVGAWIATHRLGGSDETARDVLVAVGIGSIATFIPAVLTISADIWGVVVLVCGVVRALTIMGVCYLVAQNNPDVAQRVLFLPAAGAAVILLFAEVLVSINMIARIDRQKVALKHTPAGTAS